MLIAQISDVHIQAGGKPAYGKIDTVAFLAKTVAALNALDPQPDVVLASGDLVERGSAEEYGLLTELLKPLKAPLFVVPGNHDARDTLAAAFPDAGGKRAAGGAFFQYAVEDFPVRLVAVDTIVPGESGGTFCATRAAWLDATLAAGSPDKPVLIFLHHPPFATGIGHMDKIGLKGADLLASVVSKHSNIERIVCGHLHRAIQARFAGTIASVCPSTAHQVVLDIRKNGPPAFSFEPPGFQLHLWRDGGPLVTHTQATGEYGGPHAFTWD
jgi:3',5'-cyclic AMP phosphodiesterase CpdA